MSYRNLRFQVSGINVDLRAGTATRTRAGSGIPDTIVGAKAEVANPDGSFSTVSVAGYSSFENLEGSDQSAYADILTGDDGNNTIWGLADDDTINGGNGNDRLIGGFGADQINGGDGLDWAEYMDSLVNGVTVALDGTVGAGGTAAGDVLTNVENLLGSDQTDNLTGNAGDNIIDPGLTGTERYYDYVDGGAGNDVLRLDYSRGDYGQGMGGGFFTDGSGSGYAERRDRTGNIVQDAVAFSGIERLWVTGTRLSDTVYGGSNADVISTGSGDDSIYAGTGDDWIDAGDGADFVAYGTGNDRKLTAGYTGGIPAANLRIDGGRGIDTLSMSLPATSDNIVLAGKSGEFEGINLALSNGATFANFEILKDIWTGAGADQITQLGNYNNDFRTGDGSDTIMPGFGFDTVDGGIETGGLTLNAQVGAYVFADQNAYYGQRGDRLVLDYSSLANVWVNSGSATDYNAAYQRPDGFSIFVPAPAGYSSTYLTPLTNHGYFQTYSSIDDTITNQVSYSNIESVDVTGTQQGDYLVGTGTDYGSGSRRVRGGDRLRGGGGNDVILGLSGSDELYGDDGNDTLQGTKAIRDMGFGETDVYDHDVMTGGRGADTFVLGTAGGALYNVPQYDYAANSQQVNDYNYGEVMDFNAAEGDKIVLYGDASLYTVQNVSIFGYADVFKKSTFFYRAGTGDASPTVRIDYDDRILRVRTTTGFSLNGPGVQYINSSGVVSRLQSASAPVTTAAAATATVAPTTAVATPQVATLASWITQEADPSRLQTALGTGSSVVAGSGKLTIDGSGEGFGTFNGDPFGLGSGVILSTGKVTDLAGANTSSGPTGQVPRAVPLNFVKIGRAGSSDIYRADLSGLGINIRSLRLTDGNSKTGGSGGTASGFDVDSLAFSTTRLDTVSASTNLNTALNRLGVIDFNQSNLFFTPGTQRPPAGYGYGPNLEGTINGYAGSANALIEGAARKLSTFSLTGQSDSFSMGDGGSLGINLNQSVSTDGPLYLYIGEEGGTGEAVIGSVTASSEAIKPTGDLSTDLGAPGLDGDTSRMTYSFTPIAGTDLVTFQVVLFSEELPEHGGIADPDRVKVTLNGISIAALSDGASADLNTLMRTPGIASRSELILNPVGTGPLAASVRADAYTKTLTFVGRVTAGATNTLVIEAADTRDAYLDTGILIKGGTFLAAGGALPTNAAPFAVGEGIAVAFNTAYTGNVLTNDVDPNGDALTAVLASGPANGTLSFAANGSFTYTPKAGFFGNDTFSYRARDGKLDSQVATVDLVVARPPGVTADAGNPYAATEDTVLSVDASAGVLAGDSTTTGKPLIAQLVSTTRNGTLNLKADGSFVYTPRANFFGTDSFVYRASDGTLTSSNATVVINTAPQNDAPTLTLGVQNARLVEAGVSPANAVLPGTPSATIQLTKGDPEGAATAAFDATGWTNIGGGKLSKTGLYGSAVLTTATGLLSYTLDNARAATNALAAGVSVADVFDVSVKDTAGAVTTRQASFAITGSNDAPLLIVGAQSLPLVEMGIGAGGTGILGTSVATVQLSVSDPDTGDKALFQAAGWTAAGTGKLTRNGIYGSVVLDTVTGLMTYTLDNYRLATMNLVTGNSVSDSFAVTVKDNSGASTTRSIAFTILGTNDKLGFVIGAQSRPVVEAGTGIPGVPTATMALTRTGGSGSIGFVTTGWTALGGTRFSRDGIFGSAVLDTATGQLTYTLDNARGVTNDLEAGDIRTDVFAVTVRDGSGASLTQAASFRITGSGDGFTINGSAAADRISDISSAPGQPRPTKYADTIYGNDGDDVMAGLGGKDVIDGGAGTDTADYAEKTLAVTVALNGATNATVTVGGVAEDTIRNVENIGGGSAADRLTGDALANTFTGRGGNDILDGGAGSDTADYAEKTAAIAVTLNGGTFVTVRVGGVAEDTIRNIENIIGGSAGDTLTGDGYANTFSGRGGKDVIDGAGGSDTADYADKTQAVVVALNGAANVVVTVGGVAEDTLRNIENINGGAAGDTLTGDALANTLFGAGGNDLLKGGAGSDTLDGGAGVDTADYSDKVSSVGVTLNGATSSSVTVGGVAEDTIRNIENLIGGSAGDVFIGDGQANTFSGRAGKDILDGGAGVDTADYSEKTLAVSVALNGATNAGVTVGGVAEDTIRNIENLIGGSAGDILIGDAQTNIFAGRGGKDVLDGGAGVDTADYAEKTSAVTVTLNGASNANVSVGGVVEDTIRNIENLVGGSAGDTFIGDTQANTFSGRAGNDILDGGAGIDTADYSEKSASVVVTLNGAANATVTVGGIAEDTIRNIENINGGSGSDILSGDGLANILVGGAGNDVLKGGGGKDVLDGGFGVDTADYTDKTAAVSVTLAGAAYATVTVGGIAEDTIRNFETILGGTASDTLIGDGLATILVGNAGADYLDGGFGNDTLTGGTGADRFVFSTALNAQSNMDTITDFSVADDTILLSHAIFSALGLGDLQAADLAVGAAATTASQNIIYDATSGRLFYDADGSGLGAQVQFATLKPGLAIGAADFKVV